MSENYLFNGRTCVWFPSCAKFSRISDNHEPWAGLVSDIMSRGTPIFSGLRQKILKKIDTNQRVKEVFLFILFIIYLFLPSQQF